MQNSRNSQISRSSQWQSQSSWGQSQNAILDQPIPLTTQRRLARLGAPLIRTPTTKELKRLQNKFKNRVVTRRVNKAFNQTLTDYNLQQVRLTFKIQN